MTLITLIKKTHHEDTKGTKKKALDGITGFNWLGELFK
jgi:hypothetical protein